MRKFDKINNIRKANMLSEQRYLKLKGALNENLFEELNINEAERISMAEFFGDVTDNVDTLIKMFSKYSPNNSWFMNVGYVNNVDLNVNIKNEDMEQLETIARKLNSPIFNKLISSDSWTTSKTTGKSFKNPYAPRQEKGIKIPSKIYSSKSFMIQWGNIKSKADKDAEVKKAYDKYNMQWPDGGEIDVADKRGSGWEPIIGTPFHQHQNTGTKRLAIYYKKENVNVGKTKYYLNFDGNIAELTPEETTFLFSLSPKSYEPKMPKRLLDLENQEAAQEIFALENTYDFKNLDLNKISYIRCSMQVDGENKKFSYVNKNVAPDGLNAGEFAQFINPS